MGVPGAAHPLAPGAGQPQGLGPEPYLHNSLLGEFALSTTKEVLPEDAWKDCNIRDRSNGFVNQAGY